MVERVSALAAVYRAGVAGPVAESGPRVRLEEIRDLRIAQIAAWPDTFARVEEALSSALGGVSAPGPGSWVPWGARARLLRVEPLRWWVMEADKAAADRPAVPDLPSDAAMGLDLSHSRTGIRVTGPSADQLLMRFMAVDLRSTSFAHGAVATGLFDHVSATVLRDDTGEGPGYDLLLPRTFAESCWLELFEAAERFGAETVPGDG